VGAATVIGIQHQSLVQLVQIPPGHEGKKMVLQMIANSDRRNEPTVDQGGNHGARGIEFTHQRQRAVFGCGAGTAMGACSVPGTWPPKGIETFDPWHLPLLNTLLLLTSGTTVTWAHHALLENDRKGLKYGLILTCILAAVVVGGLIALALTRGVESALPFLAFWLVVLPIDAGFPN